MITLRSHLTNPDFASIQVQPAVNSFLPSFRNSALYALPSAPLNEPSESASNFGRKEYWNDFYRNSPSFSWYSGWDDLAPFLQELLDPEDHILIPGVGNDATLLDMYDAGYKYLTAFDYASEGIACCQQLLGTQRMKSFGGNDRGVELFVGDARDLHNLQDATFDAILEKGTLDAVSLSGGGRTKENKKMGLKHMEMAISELSRVLKPGGLFISFSAICTDEIQASLNFDVTSPTNDKQWHVIRDGSHFFTEDGYASNNFDGTLLVWRKESR